MLKRHGIFILDAEKQKVDHYILYFLKSMKAYFSKIGVVVIQPIDDVALKNIEALSDFCVHMYEKETDQCFVEAVQLLGVDSLKQIDELVIFTSDIIGPFYDLSEMFNKMDNQGVDYWSVAAHKIEEELYPDSIFVAYRKSVLQSQDFWDALFSVSDFREKVYDQLYSVLKYHNYTLGIYAFSEVLYEKTGDPIRTNAEYLVGTLRCPLIDKHVFYDDYSKNIKETAGQNVLALYQYIKDNNLYPLDLLWDHILRIGDMTDIKDNFQLNYILPSDYAIDDEASDKKIALMMHIHFEEKILDCLAYARSMPESADVYITTNSKEKKEKIEKAFSDLRVKRVSVLLVENRGRDVSALLVGCAKYIPEYDYVCFAHDKKWNKKTRATIGENFAYKCMQNTLKSKVFVKNVINTFEREPRLGLLSPMPPNHGTYKDLIFDQWTCNFANTEELLKTFKIDVPMSEKKGPISPLGTVFWFRAKAFKTLLSKKWTYSDFPEEPNALDGTILHAIERGYSLFAQHEGYYSGFLFTNEFARMDLTNLSYYYRADKDIIINSLMVDLRNYDFKKNRIKNFLISKLIKHHKLFDEDFYLDKYDDIKNAKIAPLQHFIMFGVYEFRDPSKEISTAMFYAENFDLLLKGKNILFYYEQRQKENLLKESHN